MPHYVLPDLPYDYGALEPHISGKIMELHHGKHHAAYVKSANTVLVPMVLDHIIIADEGYTSFVDRRIL